MYKNDLKGIRYENKGPFIKRLITVTILELAVVERLEMNLSVNYIKKLWESLGQLYTMTDKCAYERINQCQMVYLKESSALFKNLNIYNSTECYKLRKKKKR